MIRFCIAVTFFLTAGCTQFVTPRSSITPIPPPVPATVSPTPFLPPSEHPTMPPKYMPGAVDKLRLNAGETFCYIGFNLMADFSLMPGPYQPLQSDASVPLVWKSDPNNGDGKHFVVAIPAQSPTVQDTLLFRVKIIGDGTYDVTTPEPFLKDGACYPPGNPL